MGDARRVKGLKAIKNALQKITALAPVQFKNVQNDADFDSGFVSQDLAKVFPEFVVKRRKGDNGTGNIPQRPDGIPEGWELKNLECLVPWIIAALQELAGDLDQVKKRAVKQIKELETKVTALEARIAALETAIPANTQKITLVEDRVTALEKKNETLP